MSKYLQKKEKELLSLEEVLDFNLMMNNIKRRKLVFQSIREYLSDRNLESETAIKSEIKAVKKVIDRLIKRSEIISSINKIEYRIIKAETEGLVRLHNELENNLELRKKIKIPLVLIRYIIKEEDIKTSQSVKLIIKTWLNIITVDKSKREKILIGFKSSLSNDLFRYKQDRDDFTKNKADQIANSISNLLFNRDESFNSRKNKNKKFLNAPFGGYLKK